MALQLIEAYIPKKYFEKVDKKLQSFDIVNRWNEPQSDEADSTLIRLLVEATKSEEILNYLESIANLIEGFEVLLFPVQTFIKKETEQAIEEKEKNNENERIKIERASRQELYLAIEGMSQFDFTFMLFIFLSSIVVTIGLIKDSAAIVIGGMVIAPLLGPIIALAFSSILGDYKLARHSLKTVSLGILIALVIAIFFSVLSGIETQNHEFMSRTHVQISDIILALASGAAGALSVLKGGSGTLVGVMVAVALLPPTIVLGMTIGGGIWSEAIGALLLILANVTSILLSAIAVFTFSGIRPIKYEEIQKAHNSKVFSLVFTSIIVVLLIIAIVYSHKMQH